MQTFVEVQPFKLTYRLSIKIITVKKDIENVKVNANMVKFSCFSNKGDRARYYYFHTLKLRIKR